MAYYDDIEPADQGHLWSLQEVAAALGTFLLGGITLVIMIKRRYGL